MKQYFFKVNSVTHAEKGAKILRYHGYNASVKRAGRPASLEGCSYSILITGGNVDEARAYLVKSNVRITGEFGGAG